MKAWHSVVLLAGFTVGVLGCEDQNSFGLRMNNDSPRPELSDSDDSYDDQDVEEQEDDVEGVQDEEDNFNSEDTAQEEMSNGSAMEYGCDGAYISAEAAQEMYELTEVTDYETIYTTYDRIDGIATLFEQCSDPWGLFPTTYRHITARIIEAIENGEIDDQEWGKRIVLDFAGRYLANLQEALVGGTPSYAWEHYYYLADRSDVSRTRAVVVAMIAHLTLDLPYSLVAVETTEDHKDDYFVLGELMIEITDDFLADLEYYYDTDASDLINGFFFGEWVDGTFGEDTTVTFNYQTIRTKSWNNRWYLEQWWGVWIAESEIYTAFWTMDGILASLDAAGTI